MATETTAKKKGGLRKAVKAVNDTIKDFTSLHVQTYTGTLQINLTETQGFDTVRMGVTDELAKKDKANIILVAEAYYQFDGDSYNFISSDEDVPARALEMHKAAVEAGMKTRQGLMQLVKDAFD